MIPSIQEAINELQDEISEKESYIQLLTNAEQFVKDGKAFTEEVYHNLCCTPLRHSDLLGEFLINVFPCLQYDSRQCNYFMFSTEDGLRVLIPSSVTRAVYFIMPSIYTKQSIEKHKNLMQIEPDSLTSRIELTERVLTEKSLIKKIKMVYPDIILPVALMKYLYNHIDKQYKKNLDILEAKLAKIKIQQENESKKISAEIDQQNYYINTYASNFLNWTSKIIVCTKYDFSLSITPHIIVTKGNNGNIIAEENN